MKEILEEVSDRAEDSALMVLGFGRSAGIVIRIMMIRIMIITHMITAKGRSEAWCFVTVHRASIGRGGKIGCWYIL